MKKAILPLIAVLFMCILTVCAAADDGLIFYLNSEDGVKWISGTNNLKGAFDSDAGYYRLTNTTHDPNFQHNFSSDAFDTAEYPVVRYRFKIVNGTYDPMPFGQFFFETDNGAKIGDNGTYINYDLKNTADWQDIVIDMRTIKDSKWSGKIKTFRVDPVQAPQTTMTVLVDHVGFFKTVEDATDNTISDITYTYGNQKIFIPAGTMSDDMTEDDFTLASEQVDEAGKADGYEPVIFLKDADGNENVVALSYSNGKKFYYVARQVGTYRAGYYAKEYADTADHWGLDYIRFVSARKLFGGTSETEFSPDMTMTRGMFITVLGRMHGVNIEEYAYAPSFADVPADEYYAPYINWATKLEIASPVGEGTFAPEEPITRVDMAQILANYVAAYGYELNEAATVSAFTDLAGLDDAKIEAIKKMQKAGIINGKGEGTFDPYGISTRAEVATVMARIIKSVLGLPLKFGDNASESIILNLTDKETTKNISVSGNGSIETGGEGLLITGYNDQFFLTYTPSDGFYLEEYPYVKICYKINSSPSKLAQFYYYTDKTVTEEVTHPYVQFTMDGEIGEWNTMSFDFSTIDKVKAMPASSESAWEGKLSKFAIYPLRMFSGDKATTRDMLLKYIAFFPDEESMNQFDETKLEYNGTSDTEVKEELMISENLGKQDRIHIGAFFPYHVNVEEKDIAELAEAGIDISFVNLASASLYAKEHLLDWHAKYGIMAWLDDGSLRSGTHICYSPDKKELIENSYADHPAFYGNIFSDEPGIVHYEGIGKYVSEYYNDFPDKVPFVNLLPMYASNDQLTYGASAQKIAFYDTPVSNYEDYVRRYAEAIDTPYISTDIYPLNWNTTKNEKSTYKDYVKSIEIVAKVCRETGREFWCYIQSFDSKSRAHFRAPEGADIRWQAYSMLSFGIKTMFYYVWHGAETTDYTATPINEQGGKNEIWYAAKDLNNEFIAISPVYLQYKNIGAFTHNAESKPYAQMLEPLESFAPIAEVKCDETLLLGCFEKEEGEGYAFTVVNMSEMKDNKTVSVSLKINGDKVTSYFGGEAQVMTPDANGYYSFDLVCGDGVFVTVE